MSPSDLCLCSVTLKCAETYMVHLQIFVNVNVCSDNSTCSYKHCMLFNNDVERQCMKLAIL